MHHIFVDFEQALMSHSGPSEAAHRDTAHQWRVQPRRHRDACYYQWG